MNMNRDNIYLRIPIERCREDAIAGVSLAREAYTEREPEKARLIGIGVTAEQAKRKHE